MKTYFIILNLFLVLNIAFAQDLEAAKAAAAAAADALNDPKLKDALDKIGEIASAINGTGKADNKPVDPNAPDPNARGGWTYDYKQNGADWGSLVSSNRAINYCGQTRN